MHIGERPSLDPHPSTHTPTMTPQPSTLTLSFPFADSTPTPSSTDSTLATPQSATFILDSHPDHPHPCVPSTFLPSYYPDSRDRLPLLPSQQHQQHVGGSVARAGPHSAADVDRISASGPSTRHLLDGVALASSPLRPSGPTMTTPTYDLSPTAYTGGLPQHINTWVPKRRGEWNDLPFGDLGEGSSAGGAGQRSFNPSASSTLSPAALPQPPLLPPQPSLASFSPTIAAPQSTNSSPSLPVSRIDPPGGAQAQSPYTESYHMGASRSYPGTAGVPSSLPPANAAFPEVQFGEPALADSSSTPVNWNRDESKVSGNDYARALSIYEQLQSASSHIRPISQSAPVSRGQEFDKLLRLAQDGILAVTGQQVLEPVARLAKPSPGAPQSTSSNKRMHVGKDKPPTKCLGCGATETPEWRRGPMGPRTLCNACGLVHIKLQRKKRKLEEKAAAAAAAAAAAEKG